MHTAMSWNLIKDENVGLKESTKHWRLLMYDEKILCVKTIFLLWYANVKMQI